jgi:hypothetical protein
VLRGHLLVIPLGKSLLYVEPVYLQAERSPMPELRMVVLATQERLAYGTSFQEALVSLFGDSVKAPPQPADERQASADEKTKEPATATPGRPSASVIRLIERALQEFDEYQKLTAAGKLAEAGQKLEQHKRTLEELRRATTQQ